MSYTGGRWIRQTELAAAFDVDRTTIRAWHSRGLPYHDSGRGRETWYSLRLALLWEVARNLRERLGLDRSSDTIELLALVVAMGRGESLNVVAEDLHQCDVDISDGDLQERVEYWQGFLDARGMRAR